MTTSADMFLTAIEHIEKPFPKRVNIAANWSLPIFNTGMGHWHIVDAAGSGDVVATVMFPMPTDPKEYMAKKYLTAVQAKAERLATVINKGLEA